MSQHPHWPGWWRASLTSILFFECLSGTGLKLRYIYWVKLKCRIVFNFIQIWQPIDLQTIVKSLHQYWILLWVHIWSWLLFLTHLYSPPPTISLHRHLPGRPLVYLAVQTDLITNYFGKKRNVDGTKIFHFSKKQDPTIITLKSIVSI